MFLQNKLKLSKEYVILEDLVKISARKADRKYIEGYLRYLEVYVKVHKITDIKYLRSLNYSGLSIDYFGKKIDIQRKDMLYLYQPFITPIKREEK